MKFKRKIEIPVKTRSVTAQKRHQQKMLEKLKQLRLFPAVSTFTEAKEWIAILEERSGWFETKKSLKTLPKNAR